MPIYEYVCIDCNNEFETLVLSSDEKVVCPSCESTRLEKKMSCFSSSGISPLGGLANAGGCSGSGGFS